MDPHNGFFDNELTSGKIILFTWDALDDWQVIHVSSSITPILGYTPEDFLHSKLVYADLIHPDDIQRVKAEVNQAIHHQNAEFTHQIYRIKDKSGNYRHVYDHTKIIRNAKGEVVEFHGYISDETDILEQKTRLELVLEGTHLGMWDWYPQTNEVMFDDNWAEMLGYKLSEITPSLEAWESRVHPDDIEQCFADIHAHIEGKTDYYENVHRMRHKNGEWLYILDRGKIAERDKNGQPVRFTGTHTNITQLRKVQDELEKEKAHSQQQTIQLQETSERFKSLLELASEAIFIVDASTGKLLEYSEMTKQYLGYDDDEMQSLYLYDWDKNITPEEFENLSNSLNQNLTVLTRVHTRKDGSTYDASIQARKVEIDGKKILHATVRDITEQNRLQKLLEAEQQYNSTIVNNANAIIAVINLDGVMLRLNEYGQKFVGYSAAEVAAEPYFWSRFLNENVKDKVQSMITRASQDDITKNFRNTWLHHSGQERMIEWSNTLMYDDEDNIIGIFTIGIDIQEQFTLEEELRHAHVSLAEAQAVAKLGFWELEAATNKLYWNNKVFEIFGADAKLDTPSFEFFMSFVHPSDRESLETEYKTSIAEQRNYRLTHRATRRDGREIYLEERCHHEFNKSGNLVRSIGTVLDITDLVRTNQKLELANNIIKNAINGILITNADNRIIDVNQAFLEISGYSKAELINQHTHINKSGLHNDAFYKKLREEIKQTGHWKGQITNRRKDGTHYTCLLNISSIHDQQGDVVFYAAIYSDITDIKKSQEKLDYLAHHDQLTHLPNRTLFSEELEQALRRAERLEYQLALVFFDIDRFKQINDTFGHHQGDCLLQLVANRVLEVSRAEDLFARIGGDEFVMLIENPDTPESTGFLANRIIQAFDQPFELEDGLVVNVTSSIGIAIYPQDGIDSAALLSNADSAMYSAKALGGGQYQYYSPDLTHNVKQKLTIETQLRQTIQEGGFSLHYQPQIRLKDNQLCGFEALLRWPANLEPVYGPDTFIPIAEETGLINQIGDWVIDTVFKQAKEWLHKGIEFGYIAINVSALQFQNGELPAKLKQKLKHYQLDGCFFELEVTEGVLIKHPENVLKQLNEIRALGFSISIDDFGTGFSSMNYLKRLPAQKLKVDRSFISDIPHDLDDVAITKTIIAMGHNLGLGIVAEGVETQQQCEFLKAQNCQECQGYFFSKPMDVEACEDYILNHGISQPSED